jgi:tRNA 2-thiouridine synthesizing protein A
VPARRCGIPRHPGDLIAKMPRMTINADLELDVKGLECPMPLLKAKLALNTLAPQQILKVVATDPGSERDFHSFIQQSRHQLLEFHKDGSDFSYWIQKG